MSIRGYNVIVPVTAGFLAFQYKKFVTKRKENAAVYLGLNAHCSNTKTQVILPEQTKIEQGINIAVSSRALFKLEEEHNVFDKEGLQKYLEFQRSRLDLPLDPGSAFPLIRAVQNVNKKLTDLDKNEKGLFNVVLLSHNHGEVGLRIIKSLEEHNLSHVNRMGLTGGTKVTNYLQPYDIHLFLTNYEDEAKEALNAGFAAASLYEQSISESYPDQLRIAFDLDSVIFSDEAEIIYKTHNLDTFMEHEKTHKERPLPEGPMKQFATRLAAIQKKFYDNADKFANGDRLNIPIRTFVVTSRSVGASERALNTLRSWNLEMDEIHFLSGKEKSALLKTIQPHIFFDDQKGHIEKARSTGVPSAHVPSGIANN